MSKKAKSEKVVGEFVAGGVEYVIGERALVLNRAPAPR
jgi:hypothetical protein